MPDIGARQRKACADKAKIAVKGCTLVSYGFVQVGVGSNKDQTRPGGQRARHADTEGGFPHTASKEAEAEVVVRGILNGGAGMIDGGVAAHEMPEGVTGQ